MTDAQGNSSSSSSSSSTLSLLDDDAEVKDYTSPETGEEFFHEEEKGGDEEGEEGEGKEEEEEEEGKEEEEEDEDEDEDEEEEEMDEDEKEEAKLNSAAAKADNPFQESTCPWMIYSRQEEIRRILQALRGQPEENPYKRCTRCKAMGHVCVDCPLPIRYKPRPNQAPSPGPGKATNPSMAACAGSSSQRVDPETVVPSVSSGSASQLGKRKSESRGDMGSPTRKL